MSTRAHDKLPTAPKQDYRSLSSYATSAIIQIFECTICAKKPESELAMPVVAIIGAQWGDEGKGHIVDLLAERARLVIRYGGGNNAGHTVVNERGAFKLHVVPSGIFDSSTVNVIGTGVVIDPAELINELEDLQSQGISTAKLFI